MENLQKSSARDVVTKHEPAWFCIRSQAKREHIAAANLKRLVEMEVFNPRLRSRKATQRGPAWFTESLFPNYLFARFPFQSMFEDVKHTPGVSHVVQFGTQFPAIPENVIAELKRNFVANELELSAETPDPGDEITITGHAMNGWKATVLRVMPAKQRIEVLLEILGRTATVELNLKSIVPERRALPTDLLSRPTAAV